MKYLHKSIITSVEISIWMLLYLTDCLKTGERMTRLKLFRHTCGTEVVIHQNIKLLDGWENFTVLRSCKESLLLPKSNIFFLYTPAILDLRYSLSGSALQRQSWLRFHPTNAVLLLSHLKVIVFTNFWLVNTILMEVEMYTPNLFIPF